MSGSSPLTRGKRTLAGQYGGVVGLIPAHAGKTWSIRCMAFCGPAHPRSRGENLIAPLITLTSAGSSPLTRGKRDRLIPPERQNRLIPAHAGKTVFASGSAKNVPGSSPLTRGKQVVLVGREVAHRLIPAHAGKTVHAHRRHPTAPAHPRSRGENCPGLGA